VTLAGAYVALGAYALARLPTVGDDARIWSLRGLTLAYFHRLQPEIFLNQFQAGGHPVYPLFQPVLEALLSMAIGHPQLRLYHTELWLLFAAGVWTAAYLIGRASLSIQRSFWIAALALLAASSAAVNNLVIGDADITGAVLLATGGLALGLWIERDERGYLVAAAVLLAAAANTKDEDLVASGVVLVAAGVVALVRHRSDMAHRRDAPLWLWAGAAAFFAALVTPWRIWVAAHHLSDSAEPPLPRALSPVYVLGRIHELHQTLTAMATQTLTQWGWLAAIFLALCIICLVTRTARRTVCFYLVALAAVVMSLLWFYTTTPLSLAFLIPTSMDRTVDVFMVLSALASAHLLAALVMPPGLPETSSTTIPRARDEVA